MPFLRRLQSSAPRLVGLGLTVGCASLSWFFLGYWLGWEWTPTKPAQIKAPAAEVLVAAKVGLPPRVPESPSPATVEAEMNARMVQLARELTSEADRGAAEARLRAAIASFDLQEVLAALAALDTAPPSGVVKTLRLRLLERWVALAPRDAFDYARTLNAGSGEPPGWPVATVLRRWAFYDPAGALQAWREVALANPAGDSDARLGSDDFGLAVIALHLGRQDLAQAVTEIGTLAGNDQAVAWRGLAGLAAQEAPRERLLAALVGLPAGSVRSEALAVAVAAWAGAGNFNDARQWLDSVQLERGEQARIEEKMVLAVFYENPRNAADWLLARARSSEERSRRLESMTSIWTDLDPTTAGRWLLAQGLDDSAASAMWRFASAISASHPAEAVAWAQSIPNEDLRQRTLQELAGRIREQYPDRADELLPATTAPHP